MVIGWGRLSARVDSMADPDDRRWDAPAMDLLAECRDLGHSPEVHDRELVLALQAADLLDDYGQVTDAGAVVLAAASRERLLRIAHAGLLALHGGQAVTISGGRTLTDEDAVRVSGLIHAGLLVEGSAGNGVTRIGITEQGEHVLAGGGNCPEPSWWGGYGPILTFAFILIVLGFVLAVLT